MDSTFSNPGEVIQVIKALADPTRLAMLLNMNSNAPKGVTASRLNMNSNAPKGVTASRLADRLGKKIPTILHHLEKLQELRLAEYHMAENEAGRKIKHWRVVNPNFLLEINLNVYVFTDARDEIDIYILYLFEEEKKRKGTITFDYTKNNTVETICEKVNTYLREVKTDSNREVTISQAQEILSKLEKKGELEKQIRIWVFKAFRDSAASLQLDFFELGTEFALGPELRGLIYEHFISSNKFSSIGYSDQGQPVVRLKLRPEFLDDPDA
ncbi:MAG: winged helix-turn-helix domain-containing protein [Candidatus Hodarchaeales archaeon]